MSKLKELTENAHDIGTVQGVLQGIELTPSLLPNQKEAIADAKKAMERIAERNRKSVWWLSKLTEANETTQRH